MNVNPVSDAVKGQLAAEVEEMKLDFVKQYGWQDQYQAVLAARQTPAQAR